MTAQRKQPPQDAYLGTLYAVPDEQRFEATGETVDFLSAPDLERVAGTLISRYGNRFAHLEELTIIYTWKREGGTSHGAPRLGQCQKLSGLTAYLSGESDFVIWLAADHAQGLTARQIEAALFHEMSHIGWDSEKERATILPHDAELFSAEVQEYGLWRRNLQEVAPAFHQLHLLENDGVTGVATLTEPYLGYAG